MIPPLRLGKLALTLTFGALACGGRAADHSSSEQPSYSAPRANPASPPVELPPLRPLPAPMNPPPPLPPSTPYPQPAPIPSEADLAKAAAENVLQANCGYCHGSALTPAQAQDGINYINDINQLVEMGLILPLDSVGSRIIEVMRNGSQPPPSSGYPRMTDADIDRIASYIDNPRYWPIYYPTRSADAGLEAPIVDAGLDGG